MADKIRSDVVAASTPRLSNIHTGTNTNTNTRKRKFQSSQKACPSSELSSLPSSSESEANKHTHRTESLRSTLSKLQAEKRSLLRQLHEHHVQPSTLPQGATTATRVVMLPSMSAHWSPTRPLTPTEEAAAGERARGAISEHIALLTEYNRIRDVAQALIGMVAESRGVRVRDCQEEFGVVDGD